MRGRGERWEDADAVVGNDEGEGNPSRVAERESGQESREEWDGDRVPRAGSKNNGGGESNRRRAEVKGGQGRMEKNGAEKKEDRENR